MKKKINIVNVILLASLSAFLATKSLATSLNNTEIPKIYLGTNYKLSISHFTSFSVQETHQKVDIIGLKSNVPNIGDDVLKTAKNFNTQYNPAFKNNFTGFSGALGYHLNKDLRLELEASYQDFDVKKNKKYKTSDAHRYFALVRKKNDKIFQPQDDTKDLSNNYRSFYSFMKNNGVSIASVMFNGCYDLQFNNLKISSYACIGIGGDF